MDMVKTQMKTLREELEVIKSKVDQSQDKSSLETGDWFSFKIPRWKAEVSRRVKRDLDAFVEELDIPAKADSMTKAEKIQFAVHQMRLINSVPHKSVELLELKILDQVKVCRAKSSGGPFQIPDHLKRKESDLVMAELRDLEQDMRNLTTDANARVLTELQGKTNTPLEARSQPFQFNDQRWVINWGQRCNAILSKDWC